MIFIEILNNKYDQSIEAGNASTYFWYEKYRQ